MPKPTRKSHQRKLQLQRRSKSTPMFAKNKSVGSQQYLMESNISSFPRPTACHIGRNSGVFPDEFYNTMKVDVNYTHAGAAQSAATYSINGPSYLFGPQADWAGAFAANYPAGIEWLLGTAVLTGSSAPYRFSTVLSYRFEFEFINSTAAAIDIIIFPSINPSYIGMPKSNLAEQRGAIKMVVPASSIAGPYRCRLSGKVNELFGITAYDLQNDTDYVQIVGSAPTRQCFMHVVVGAKDGTTSVSLASTLTAYLDIKFGGLNPTPTATPTLLKSADGLQLIHEQYSDPEWERDSPKQTITHNTTNSSFTLANPPGYLGRTPYNRRVPPPKKE